MIAELKGDDMKNKYVLEHDYGYGKDIEESIKKLTLRNLQDCKDYIEELLSITFDASLHNSVLCFRSNKELVEIVIEKL